MADTSLQHHVAVKDSDSGLSDQGGGPSFHIRGPQGVFQLLGDHTPPPGYWKGEFRRQSNLGLRRNNVVFVLATEHWTSSIPSAGCSRVHGSLPNQSTCALWTWRRHSTVSLVAFCGRCSGIKGLGALCCPLSPVLFIIVMDSFSRHSQGSEGVGFGSHWMMLSCWLLRARNSSMSVGSQV